MTIPSLPLESANAKPSEARALDASLAQMMRKPLNPWRRLARNLRYPPTLLGFVLCLLFLVTSFTAPLFAPFPYQKMAVGITFDYPSAAHLFGTDEFGRDVFSRVLYGSQISLRIGLTVCLLAGGIGALIGLVSGFVGGAIDELVMRIADVFQAVPALVLAMTIATALGPSIENAILGIAVVRWTAFARLMRAGVLIEKYKEYVEAARAVGVPIPGLLWRHILPNSYSATLIQVTLEFGTAILLAAGLSFIGAGAQRPTPEWGAMVSDGRQYVTDAWWIATFPGLAIFAVVIGFNLLGDALRDYLDPRLRHGV
jgi:peptide/nickel transport system permease protein